MSTRRGTSDKVPEDLQGIDRMYRIYEKLNIASDKTTLYAEFRELLKAVGRTGKEKRLASQFITRFVDGFPLLYDEAINALLDLCEEEDISIRKQVVKDLVTVCKKVSAFVPKIADALGQLMVTDDSSEYVGLQTALTSLFHIDAEAALVGVFSQLSHGEEASIREKLVKFLGVKFKDLGPEIITLELEKSLLKEFKEVALDLSKEDFGLFKSLAKIVIETKYVQYNLKGQQSFVDIISQLMDVENDFDGTEPTNYDHLIWLSRQALLFISSRISATEFVKYYCFKVLPNLNERYLTHDRENLFLHTLMYMAEFTSHVQKIDSKTASQCLEVVYPMLIDTLPLPNEEDQDKDTTIPKFEFSVIECFLFMLHKLGREVPEFLASNEDRMKDLGSRIQHLARATQAYLKAIRGELLPMRDLLKYQIKKPDIQFKMSALMTMTNINAMIQDLSLSRTKPLYKSKVTLSWCSIRKDAEKRKAIEEATADAADNIDNNDKSKSSQNQERKLYQPPSGKFSNRTNYFPEQPEGGGLYFRTRNTRGYW